MFVKQGNTTQDNNEKSLNDAMGMIDRTQTNIEYASIDIQSKIKDSKEKIAEFAESR